ncbi:hypothetical protein LOD99_8352 [Oopsacas minuta]|uniref:Uncharacterized protein n=1 Tax=Oopsacas minuta TaxID=111878 RepID=A0AAV7JHG6_9METZ|nr:hypothetical protein LOD99_8352 [Oopsacas minuta]
MGGNPNFLNPLSRNGCVGYLKEILKNNSRTLKRLYLGSSGLNFTGLRILKPTLLKLTDLTELDLSRNSHLDSKGWSLFADILKNLKNKELLKLFLADNNIDSNSFISILEQLKKYPFLKYLNFCGNHITSKIMDSLIEVLMRINIRRLFLSNCRINNSVFTILLNFIRENEAKLDSLVSLSLALNEFDNNIVGK